MATGNEKRFGDQNLECEKILVGAGPTSGKKTYDGIDRRGVIEDALATTLTPVQCGSLIVFSKVDGSTFTLPAPAIGLFYDFLVDAASTSVGQKVITDAGTTFIKGNLTQIVSSTGVGTQNAANGTTHRSITMNGTTQGGVVGSRYRLTCRTATQWEVEGLLFASGTVATPFATS